MFKKLLQLKTLLLVCLLAMVGTSNVWGQTSPYYTLDTTGDASTGNNSYAGSGTATVGGIEWAFEGNGTMSPWRLGGKNISNTDRAAYTMTAMGEAISSINLTVGDASSITVNSLKLIVASDKSFTSVVDEVSRTFEANSTITFKPTSDECWTRNSYYKFVFNVTVSGKNNKFVEFSRVEFYKYISSGSTLIDSDLGIAPEALDFDLYNNSSAQTVSYTTSSTGAVTVSGGTGYVETYLDGNTKTITVTPMAVTPSPQTITISQEADATYKAGSVTFTVNVYDSTPVPTHTATFSVNGVTSFQDFEEGSAIIFPKDPDDVNGKTFVGWATNTIDGTTATAPEFVTSAAMGNSDVTYYAVFAKASMDNVGWIEEELSNMSASDVFVFSTGSYAIPNDKGASAAPNATGITVTGDKITSDVPDNLKWNVGGNSEDGYIFYPNGSTDTWLYCNTTATSGSNNNIRVGGDGNRKNWKFNDKGCLVTNDTYTKRYLSLYNVQDFRGYTSDSNGAFVPKFYKYVEASYSDYCTTVAAPVVAAPVADKESGEYAYGTTVTLTQDAAAMIVYTIDGTTPSYENSVGTEYNAPIAITSDFTLKAIAVDDDGNESPVAAWEYAVTRPIAPTFSLDEGLYSSVQTLTISANDKICYKVNNGEIVETNTTSVTLRLEETQTITAYAKDANGLVSDKVSRTYKIEIPSVGLVTFNFDAENVGSLFNFGTDSYLQENSLSCSKGGVTLTVNKEEAGTAPRIDGPSNSAHHLRIYTNSTLSFTAPVGYRISDVAFVFSEGSLTCDETTYDINNATWSGLAQEITFVGKEKAFIDAINVTLVEVVNVSAAGYATFSSTNALDFTDVEGICAYTATVENEAISFTRVNKVPANTGVLLRSVEGGAVEEAVPSLTGTADYVTGNLFVAVSEDIASLASEDANNNYYILNNGSNGVGFYLANGKKVGAGKAYLAVPKTASVRGFISFDFSDPETGIATVGGNVIEGTAFDLQGRRVSTPKNGLYIINGEKMLVK